ncbi:hypothetical protein OG607_10865 [Streptomyces sp. NBC_01537]|uniref:hypothetical protein n=1 Tax=Streptomyces sp. NBC_01537 TaxID=2903896 RepID=UPI003864C5CA
MSTRHPDASTRTGAELCTAVQRRSSVRGRSVSVTTVPGRTHNHCSTASPGATVTSARPAAQPFAGAEDPVTDPDGVPPVGFAGALVDGPADALADSLAEGPDERSFDGAPALPTDDPPPTEPLHAVSTTTPATTNNPAQRGIRTPPDRPARIATSMPRRPGSARGSRDHRARRSWHRTLASPADDQADCPP